MKPCPDTATLWAHRAGEAASAAVGRHVDDCDHCRSRAASVAQSMAVLRLATSITPELDWERIDAELHDAVQSRNTRWSPFRSPARRVGHRSSPPVVEASAQLANGEGEHHRADSEVSLQALPDRAQQRKGAAASSPRDSDGRSADSDFAQGRRARLLRPALLLACAAALLLFVTLRRPLPGPELAPGAMRRIEVASVSPSSVQQPSPPTRVTPQPPPGRPALLVRSALHAARDGQRLRSNDAPAPGTFETGESGFLSLDAPAAAYELGQRTRVALGRDGAQLFSGELGVTSRRATVVLAEAGTLRMGRARAKFTARDGSLDVAVYEGSVLVERDDGVVTVRAGDSVTFTRRAAAPSTPVAPRSSEVIFLDRAEAALNRDCGRFLLGLQSLALDAEDDSVRGRARYLSARCHDERVEPKEAAADYFRYLRDFPTGPYSAAARAARSDD